MSSASSARSALDGFAAGRTPATRVVAVMAAAYYGTPPAAREPLREIMGIIEREAPGIVALEGQQGGAGFGIRPLERPFPARAEEELRRAARALLATGWGMDRRGVEPTAAASARTPGWWTRVVRAVRGLFSGAS
ncbi:MAG: hypothetical protein OEO21_11330 [Candidatus Krumholzibacteria bacterium]|nr:hypothetical protein [Candidatus Krumholzibacteria bacterium]